MGAEMPEKVAVVTGCSAGIGRTIAIALAKKDYVIIGNSRKEDERAKRADLDANAVSVTMPLNAPSGWNQTDGTHSKANSSPLCTI
jgi:NAD(P)-dependent dehydrogenase (short-subunit alcohol dehydrogenase family)